MRRQEFNVCQAGHETHDTRVVDTVQGPLKIYDWKKYQGFAGYCTGQDDVSMTLDLYGSWEGSDWVRCRQALTDTTGNVWDFGSHIGWYSIMAAELGHQVLAIDADPTNVEMLGINARNRRVKISSLCSWVADIDHLHGDVFLVKSDVEGAEDEVVRLCRPLLRAGKIQYLLLECSPEFDDYYPALIDEIRGYGYDASIDGIPITGAELGETQKNVWFACR